MLPFLNNSFNFVLLKVLYLHVTCNDCDNFYIGETGKTFI